MHTGQRNTWTYKAENENIISADVWLCVCVWFCSMVFFLLHCVYGSFWKLKFSFSLLGQPKKKNNSRAYTWVKAEQTSGRCVLNLFFFFYFFFVLHVFLSASSILRFHVPQCSHAHSRIIIIFACNSVLQNDFGHIFFSAARFFFFLLVHSL